MRKYRSFASFAMKIVDKVMRTRSKGGDMGGYRLPGATTRSQSSVEAGRLSRPHYVSKFCYA